MNENRCVSCGAIIPEGEQVCLYCKRKAETPGHVEIEQEIKEVDWFSRIVEDWVVPLIIIAAVVAFFVIVSRG